MHRTIAGDTWPRWRTPSTATRRSGGRWPAYNGIDDLMRVRTGTTCCCPHRRSWRTSAMSTTSTALVEIEGQALPDDIVPLLTSAYIDDSQRLPDMFSLRLPRPGAHRAQQDQRQDRRQGQDQRDDRRGPDPEPLIEGEITALEAEFDAGGTFTVIRGYDQAHRLFRGRRTASYVQMTASDIATKVAQRAGLKVGSVVDPHGVPAPVPGRADRLGRARPADPGQRVRGRSAGRLVLLLPAGDGGQRADGEQRSGAQPAGARAGKDLLRFRSVLSSAQQVGKVEVRGWDVATKQPLTATAPAQTRSAELPTVTPEQLAKTFGDPVYVSTDVPYRTQAEVDGAPARWPRRSPARSPSSRGWPGATPSCGRRVDQHLRAG